GLRAVKHTPAPGPPKADSHYELPVVTADRASLEASDFQAFRPLAGLPLAMTAHVVFAAIDPVTPATTSVTIVREVIRDWIGFDGVLMTDDVSMEALSGDMRTRSRASIEAGRDRRLHRKRPLDEKCHARHPAPAAALTGGRSPKRCRGLQARRRVAQRKRLPGGDRDPTSTWPRRAAASRP